MAVLNLDALRSFVVFAERLNFTRAAEALHISQPALHVKIRHLAEELGVNLYQRIGRRLELTESGRKVARFGSDLLERTGRFRRELAGADPADPVVLAAGEGAFLYLLGPGLRDHRRRAQAPVRLLTLDGEGALEAVRSGRAHLGVASLESPPSDLRSEVLVRVPQVLVVPARHALASKSDIRLTDLTGARLVVPPPGRPHRTMLSRLLDAAGVSWEVGVEASGWELMLHFVQLGAGLAVVNGSCRIPKALKARPLRELPAIAYHIFHRKGLEAASPAGALKRALIQGVPGLTW